MNNFLDPIKENIPSELKTLAHWVCWKSENRDGKPTKPPYNAKTGGYAESNNPETWVDFQTAFNKYTENGFDGVGIVLTKDDPFTGFDLDHCINAKTGEVEPWAQKIVDALNTYAEVSPSGEGIRGFLRGKLPPGGRKQGNIEFYDYGRYLTVTGHALNGNQIESRQAELEKLHIEIFPPKAKEKQRPRTEGRASLDDQALLKKAFNSRNGDKIQKLYNGDFSDYPSQSEADQALCNHLAFWFGCDFQVIDTVFRNSGLMRDKWGKKHYGDGRTYGQATIEKALNNTHETYQAKTVKSSVGEPPRTREKQPEIKNGLELPQHLMTGTAGDFAKLYGHYMEAPPVFLYFGILSVLGSILSDKLTLSSELRPEPRLYTILLGESGDDRKSTAIKAVISFIREYFPDSLNVCYGIGSAEGLQEKFTEIEDGKLILVYDELKALISKCKIEASVLLPCVNTLFENNEYESRTKKSSIKLENIRLSFLAASTVQTYENIWTSQFLDIGFTNRLFLVPGSGKRKNPIPLKIPTYEKQVIAHQIAFILELVGDGIEMSLTQDAMAFYNSWYLSLDKSIHARRIDTYAMRLLPLMAVNEHKTEIDIDIVRQVTAMMDWQLLIREQLDPIDADNKVAQIEEKIRRKLKLGPQEIRELKRSVNYQRVGIWIYDQAIKNLTGAGDIKFNSKSKAWELAI